LVVDGGSTDGCAVGKVTDGRAVGKVTDGAAVDKVNHLIVNPSRPGGATEPAVKSRSRLGRILIHSILTKVISKGTHEVALPAFTAASDTWPRLSVVVPTKNEAGNVDALRLALDSALTWIDYEVVVVDDSTDDQSRPMLAACAGLDRRWNVIERAKADQTGLGTAVATGIAAARGDAVCVIDGDLQHPPEVIPALLSAIDIGAELAVASRYLPGGSRAGLNGTARVWASRLSTWLGQLLFPEARRTTDPLSGFFCCRRTAVSGLVLRPMGFKILFELLVLAPRLRVVDVPYTFGKRNAGESKASTRQGILYLLHLLSLFVFVPGSARPIKFAIVTASGLASFFGLLTLMLAAQLSPVAAWLIAAAASTATSLALHQVITFRALPTHGRPRGKRIHYSLAAVGAAASFMTFVLLLTLGHRSTLAVAFVAQCVGVALMASLDLPWVWRRLAPTSPLQDDADLSALGQRLGAQLTCWAELRDGRLVRLNELSTMVAPELVEQAAGQRLPVLLVQSVSSRPQPRVNLERLSTLLIPRLGPHGEAEAVAVISRRGRHVFQARHLEEAVSWMERQRTGETE
jgi:dolichol-phosphate mannosyltransferase